MVDWKKSVIGFLVIVISITAVYISLQDNARIRIDDDKSVFYVKENNRWVISALQEDRLFEGSKIVDRVINTINRYNYSENNKRIEYRYTQYSNKEIIEHYWKFDPKLKRVEEFPIKEKICISNAKGKYYRYSLKRLYEPGDKRKLVDETELSFGRNMEVNFEEGYSWAWIGWPYGKDSFAVQYKIDSDYECFNIRLFDPIALGNVKDPSFEFADDLGTPPKNWTYTGGVAQYSTTAVYNGSKSVKITQTGGSRTLLYQNITENLGSLINGSNYTLSGYIWINSSQGEPIYGILAAGYDTSTYAKFDFYGVTNSSLTTDAWEEVTVDFTYENSTDLIISVSTEGSVAGGGFSIWDDVYIYNYTATNATNTTNLTASDGTIWIYPKSNYTSSLWVIDFSLDGSNQSSIYDNTTCSNISTSSSVNISSYKNGSYALSYLSEKSSMGKSESKRFGLYRYPKRFYNNTYRILFLLNETLTANTTTQIDINVSEMLNRTGIGDSDMNESTARLYRITRYGGIYNDTANSCYEQPITIG